MHSSRMRTARISSCPGGGLHQGPPGSRPPRTRHPQTRHPPGTRPPPGADHLGPGSPPRTRHPPPGADPPGTRHPPWTEWQTGAKILPCSKLRLRAVITVTKEPHCLNYKIQNTENTTVACRNWANLPVKTITIICQHPDTVTLRQVKTYLHICHLLNLPRWVKASSTSIFEA